MSFWDLFRSSDPQKEKSAPEGRSEDEDVPGQSLEEEGPTRDAMNEEIDTFTRLYRKPLKKLAE